MHVHVFLDGMAVCEQILLESACKKTYKVGTSKWARKGDAICFTKMAYLLGNDGLWSGSQRRFFPSLALIVSWLLAMINSITFHVFMSTASRESVLDA